MSFEELVARQAGVVSLAQAVAHGYSACRAHRRVREGRWRRVHPGVFLVGGHRLTDEARVRAAWLWAANPGVARSAAAGSVAAGSVAAGSGEAGSAAAGSETAGSESAGSETAGSETAGSETAGSETAGSETA